MGKRHIKLLNLQKKGKDVRGYVCCSDDYKFRDDCPSEISKSYCGGQCTTANYKK